jgi:hypothetical protein
LVTISLFLERLCLIELRDVGLGDFSAWSALSGEIASASGTDSPGYPALAD